MALDVLIWIFIFSIGYALSIRSIGMWLAKKSDTIARNWNEGNKPSPFLKYLFFPASSFFDDIDRPLWHRFDSSEEYIATTSTAWIGKVIWNTILCVGIPACATLVLLGKCIRIPLEAVFESIGWLFTKASEGMRKPSFKKLMSIISGIPHRQK